MRDDGRGAPAPGRARAAGSTGMRERAAALGGRFEAGGAPGGGFRVLAPAARGPAVIRVALVDDQALMRAGLRALLDAEDDLEVVGEAGDGEAGRRARARRSGPTSCSWTSACPVLDGLEATRRIVADAALDRRQASSSSRPSSSTSTSSRRCAPGRAASCSRTRTPRTCCAPCASWPRASRCSRRRVTRRVMETFTAGAAARRPGARRPRRADRARARRSSRSSAPGCPTRRSPTGW